MVHDAMAAFRDLEVARARAVLERDDDADSIRDTIFRVLLTYMMADPATVERALGLIFVSRALERVADHATNISEDVIFLVEGHMIRRVPD
jgi:phosphate transport system protein